MSGRTSLDARVLAWMREVDPSPDERRFEELALALFRFQFEHCPAYARFCRGRGRTPARVRSWREVPAVPTGAWKEVVLRCFPEEREIRAFRTSGTSSERRGTLHLDTLELYEASLASSFEAHVLPEWKGSADRVRLLVLAPAPEEAPDSSLSHMFGVMVERRGDAESGFFVRKGTLQHESLLAALRRTAEEGAPLALCGTAFGFVHLLEWLRERGECVALPASARVMETGGFKGRVDERDRDSLYAEIGAQLGIPAERIVNQYGMTELGSQFYDSILRFPREPRRKLGPPWTRVRILDPESGAACPRGRVGMIQVVDLANTGSVAFVQTADLGRRVGDGFEVLGRAAGAETRGCSIAADEMLGAAG